MGNTNDKEHTTNEELKLMKQMQQQIMGNQLDIQRMQLNNLHQIQGIPNTNNINDFSSKYQEEYNKNNINNDKIKKREFLINLLNNKQKLNNEQIIKVKSLINKLNSELGYELNKGINLNGDEIGQRYINYGTQKQQNYNDKQVSNNELYKYDYNKEEELNKRDYEIKKEKLKQEYLENQRKRKLEFDNKMNELKSKTNEALKLFNLNIKFTSDELKNSYRKLAMKTHPDKYGGDDSKFKLVTEYFFLLKSYLNEMNEHKSHNEFKNYYSKPKPVNTDVSRAKMGIDNNDGQGFNIKLFNKIFDENRIYDESQEGYEDWLKGNNDIKQPKLFSKKFNLDVFNETFEQFKIDNPNNQIIEYKEPQALVSSDTLGYGTNIDNSKGNGFTKWTGGGNSNELGYCDLKEAYTNGNLISSLNASRNEYKNIDELERDRSNIRYEMTPEELANERRKKIEEENREDLRLQRIKENDFLSEKHYNNVHERLLGYSSTPDMSR